MSGIDVKTLRDGDFVRAEGVRDGKPWAAEGVVERCSYGECAAQVRVGPAFGADIHLVDCTVTMLRPVLVKGDRVDLRGVTHQVESVHENGCIVITDANYMPRAVHIADLTRLPAAPEPAQRPFQPAAQQTTYMAPSVNAAEQARALLAQGMPVADVAQQTGLAAGAVAGLAASMQQPTTPPF